MIIADMADVFNLTQYFLIWLYTTLFVIIQTMSRSLPQFEKLLSSKYTAIAIILIVSFGVYLNTLSNGFVYDDESQVLNNPWIKNIRHIPQIFLSDIWGFKGEAISHYYRPLIHIVYTIDYYIFGLKPWGFRLSFMLLHAGASVLVFLIASKLVNNLKLKTDSESATSLRWSAFIAAILFAVHPIHTEALGWGGGEPLFAFFYLSSFYHYMKADRIWGWRFILSLFFFFLSTLSKETTLTLPLLLFAYDYSLRKDYVDNSQWTVHNIIKKYFPYLIVIGIYFIMRIYAIGGVAPVKSHTELNNYEYFINIFPLFIQYLEKLILPTNLNVYHVFHPILSLSEWKGIISISLTLAFFCLAYLFRKNRIVFFSFLWIVIPLLPVLYIPALAENTFTERYLYLPSVGFVILLSLIVEKVYRLRLLGQATVPLIGSMLIIISGLYSIGTIKRNYIYRDNYTLWLDTVEKSADAHIPHNNIGLAYYDRGRMDEAIKEYLAALKLRPDYAIAYNNLGNVYSKQGRLDKAIKEYLTALRLRPDYVDAHINLGNVHYMYGLFDETIKEYMIALRLRPDYAIAYNNLGNVYSKQGRLDEAIKEYMTALKLNPEFDLAHYNLGNAYKTKGLKNDAIKEFEIALKLKPNFIAAKQALDNESQTYRLK